jgi:hypothetical protein
MSTVLIALVPINFFFVITTTRTSNTYAFIVLLNIAVFTLAGFFALTNFVKGAEVLYGEASENWKPAFLLGSLILMVVGTQLAWVLRPYFDYYPWFIRPLESNFYTAMAQLISQHIGPEGAYFIGFLVVVVIVSLFAIILTQAEPFKQAMRPEDKKEEKEEGKGEEEAQTLDL